MPVDHPESYLAIDLGAESGRAVLGEFDGERVSLREIGRFATGRGDQDICDDGVLRWDIDSIYGQVCSLYAQANREAGGPLGGIGVDSWGVDFGLFDKNGKRLARPICYRDHSHVVARDAVTARMPAEEIWDATGIQGLAFNTLYQIEAIQKRDPSLLDRAHRLLFVPDLVHNLLTGGAHHLTEVTNASTSQMMRPGGDGWNYGLLEKLGLPSNFLPEIISAGTAVGKTAIGSAPVFAPATHDTASAVVATPSSPERNWAFLSSGTWSLIGAELPAPMMDRQAMRLGFSNEVGAGGTIRLLKNIMGLWLVQQTRRALRTAGTEYSYAELTELAGTSAPGALIDAVAERFLNPENMIDEIRAACRETGQPDPSSAGGLARCCLESLALAYRRSLRQLGELLGREFSMLHIVGGGSQNALLNQWTADACGIPVYAGPAEATALGNILGQMVGAGAVAGWPEARELSRRSFSPVDYYPDPCAQAHWAEREEVAARAWENATS